MKASRIHPRAIVMLLRRSKSRAERQRAWALAAWEGQAKLRKLVWITDLVSAAGASIFSPHLPAKGTRSVQGARDPGGPRVDLFTSLAR
jgi:hypothetical protein